MSNQNSTPHAHNGQLNTQTKVLADIGQLTEQGATWLTKDDLLTVRAAVDLRSVITGFVIPAGTIGKILEADKDGMIVDFGLSTVHKLPRDSKLIEVAK
ncbi:MAG: hypothetical protein KDJ52_00345 [Anaerolineae bacterium]|nr:hypothetical protein [Anaerolineae bacterium]